MKGGPRIPYTPEQRAFVLAHYRIDMKAKDIAEHLGTTINALMKYAYELRKDGLMDKRQSNLGTAKALPIGIKRGDYFAGRQD